jgi:hypothetical protein
MRTLAPLDERVGGIGNDTVGRSHTAKDFDGLSEVATDLEPIAIQRCRPGERHQLASLGRETSRNWRARSEGGSAWFSFKLKFAIAVGQDLILRIVHLEFRQQRPGSG